MERVIPTDLMRLESVYSVSVAVLTMAHIAEIPTFGLCPPGPSKSSYLDIFPEAQRIKFAFYKSLQCISRNPRFKEI